MSSEQTDNREQIRFGDHCSRAFRAYFDQVGEWIPIVLVAAAVYVAAMLCCYLPVFVVTGPLVCGLHHCGLRAIRGHKPEMASLRRGWEIAGRAVVGSWLLMLLRILPALLIVGGLAGGIALLAEQNPVWLPQFPQDFVVERPVNDAGPPPEDFAVPNEPQVERQLGRDVLLEDQPGRDDRPQIPRAEINPRVLIFVVAFYASMFVVMGITTIWSFWISTRTLFVMPLMAEKNIGIRQAFKMSWHATRQRFWELLFLNLIASLVSVMGLYACYIGIVFSVPLYFTFIASAYDERFPED